MEYRIHTTGPEIKTQIPNRNLKSKKFFKTQVFSSPDHHDRAVIKYLITHLSVVTQCGIAIFYFYYFIIFIGIVARGTV